MSFIDNKEEISSNDDDEPKSDYELPKFQKHKVSLDNNPSKLSKLTRNRKLSCKKLGSNHSTFSLEEEDNSDTENHKTSPDLTKKANNSTAYYSNNINSFSNNNIDKKDEVTLSHTINPFNKTKSEKIKENKHRHTNTGTNHIPEIESKKHFKLDSNEEGILNKDKQKKFKIINYSPSERFVLYDEKIGEGQFKKVYRAYDYDQGREVAWNIITLGSLCEVDIENVEKEITILKKLKHSKILNYISGWFDEVNKEAIIITEIFSGGSLKQYLNKIGHPRIRAIKQWIKEILEGLSYLHNRNIIHRDIKCDNIFINCNDGHIKIGDLGFSCRLKGNSCAKSLSGTPEFMAPEVLNCKYGVLADIYSFGLCLLEIATLERPYKECKSIIEVFEKLQTGALPKSLEKVKNPNLKEFINLCMKDEDSRPSADTLLEHSFLYELESEENFHTAIESIDNYSKNDALYEIKKKKCKKFNELCKNGNTNCINKEKKRAATNCSINLNINCISSPVINGITLENSYYTSLDNNNINNSNANANETSCIKNTPNYNNSLQKKNSKTSEHSINSESNDVVYEVNNANTKYFSLLSNQIHYNNSNKVNNKEDINQQKFEMEDFKLNNTTNDNTFNDIKTKNESNNNVAYNNSNDKALTSCLKHKKDSNKNYKENTSLHVNYNNNSEITIDYENINYTNNHNNISTLNNSSSNFHALYAQYASNNTVTSANYSTNPNNQTHVTTDSLNTNKSINNNINTMLKGIHVKQSPPIKVLESNKNDELSKHDPLNKNSIPKYRKNSTYNYFYNHSNSSNNNKTNSKDSSSRANKDISNTETNLKEEKILNQIYIKKEDLSNKDITKPLINESKDGVFKINHKVNEESKDDNINIANNNSNKTKSNISSNSNDTRHSNITNTGKECNSENPFIIHTNKTNNNESKIIPSVDVVKDKIINLNSSEYDSYYSTKDNPDFNNISQINHNTLLNNSTNIQLNGITQLDTSISNYNFFINGKSKTNNESKDSNKNINKEIHNINNINSINNNNLDVTFEVSLDHTKDHSTDPNLIFLVVIIHRKKETTLRVRLEFEFDLENDTINQIIEELLEYEQIRISEKNEMTKALKLVIEEELEAYHQTKEFLEQYQTLLAHINKTRSANLSLLSHYNKIANADKNDFVKGVITKLDNLEEFFVRDNKSKQEISNIKANTDEKYVDIKHNIENKPEKIKKDDKIHTLNQANKNNNDLGNASTTTTKDKDKKCRESERNEINGHNNIIKTKK